MTAALAAFERHLAVERDLSAHTVRAYLGDQGIGKSVVSAVGFGERRPVATNGTASGRQQNRRVEIIVSGASIGRTPER